jgi:transposase-like protein
MKLHRNAKLSVKGRELLVERIEHAGWSLTQAAEAAGVSDRTARKWLARYRADGPLGLLDRSSTPATVANRTDERRRSRPRRGGIGRTDPGGDTHFRVPGAKCTRETPPCFCLRPWEC